MKSASLMAGMVSAVCMPAVAPGGASIVVPVSQDESVCSIAPEKNYAQNTNRGGLFVGSDGTGCVSRFYLQFQIPSSVEANDLVSASLWATYFDDLDRSDNGVSRIHFVAADDWSEDTITWDNQPGPTFGTPEASFDPSTAALGDVVEFDLSSIVRQELHAGDRVISLLFTASNESSDRSNRNWEYFAEREFNPDKAFNLTLQTTARVGGGTGNGGAIPVPLPPGAWPALVTLAGASAMAWRRRWRRG